VTLKSNVMATLPINLEKPKMQQDAGNSAFVCVSLGGRRKSCIARKIAAFYGDFNLTAMSGVRNRRMMRIWINGTLLVTAVAVLKTFVISRLVVEKGMLSYLTVLELFVFFFVLTAVVAYLSITQLRAYLERQRKGKLTPGAGKTAAKETVILNYAPDWGLSQSEADVAIFAAKGFSNAEIAEMRGCALATVKSQLSRIYHKSGLDSRYQLIAFVTDEVVAMANEPTQGKKQLKTKNALPLVGRNKSVAETTTS
jgi:DNA-binding CsgD family transcriptional regulator